MAVCLLVRHGHSSANADGVLAGWTPGVALTDRGVAQAAAVAADLAGLPVTRIVSSPLDRCRDTAGPLAAALGLPIETDDDLGECHYGGWTGGRLADLAKDPLWRVVQDDPASARFPDTAAYRAESLAQMAARVVNAVRRLDDEVTAEHGTDAVWVAVSHGDPIKSVLADAAGAGLAGLQRIHVDPGSLSVIRRTDGRSLVVTTNRRVASLSESLGSLEQARGRPGDAPVGGGSGSAASGE